METYQEFLRELIGITNKENIFLNEPMKNHTSFKIGGCADIFVQPKNADELIKIIQLAQQSKTPYFVMGNGSNLLVTEKGIRGLVIKTNGCLKEIKIMGNQIFCEAGVLLSQLANFAMKNSLTGLEFASGIPGTLGGAIVMNAGAYDGEMKDVTVKTKYIDEDGKIGEVIGEQHAFGYRTSIFQGSNKIILNSELRLQYGEQKEIREKMNDLNRRRREKQPLTIPSAGSVFRRPKGYYAGKLIQDSGLRGYQIGGAKVSEKHCGFIVNTGNATADDVLNLIAHIQDVVQSKFGVTLQTEVKTIGEK